jgi:membrane protein DedA with SNARE-associated domain
MDALTANFFAFLLLYKYEALFLISFTAAFALPVPGSMALFVAGALASQGYFNLGAVIVVAFAANIAGDIAGFFLARHYGAAILTAVGFRRLFQWHHYRRVADYISDFSSSLIFFTRFLTEIGPLVNVLSGLAAVPPAVFVFFAVAGEICYVLVFGMAGYFFGMGASDSTGFLVGAIAIVYSIGFIVIGIQTAVARRGRRASSR